MPAGGDSNCKVRIASPTQSQWTSTSVSDSFTAGTRIQVEWDVVCPSGYCMVEWHSEANDELDGQSHHGGNGADFTITEDTVATAVFEADEATVVNLKCDGDTLNENDYGCSGGGVNGRMPSPISWESSTENLGDLTGYVFEVICHDLSVDFATDVKPWLECEDRKIDENSVVYGPFGDPSSDAGFDIDVPWLENFGTEENGEVVYECDRWKKLASSDASDGFSPDGHAFGIPKEWAGTNSSYSYKQFFIHKPRCGNYNLLGQFTFEHGTHSSSTEFYIKMTGPGSSGDEHTMTCSEWEE